MYLYLLAVWFVLFSSTHGNEFRVEAFTEEVVLPSQTNLPINVTLYCRIHEASNLASIPKWIVQNGEGTFDIPAVSGIGGNKYTPKRVIDSTAGVQDLSLTVGRLSYKQSGTYTCEAVDSNGNFKRAAITLSLELQLEVTPKTLVVSNDTESIEMRCEMSQYIQPDNNLQWFRNGRMINNDSDKYTIHFEDGDTPSVIDGAVTQSRVSVLVVSDFEEQKDVGDYYCETVNKQTSASVYVGTEEQTAAIVTPASSTSRPTTVTSDPTSPSEDEEGGGGGLLEGIPVGTIAIAASCVGLVLIFLAMLAVITCCICCRRSKHITEARNNNSDDVITTINLWNDVSPPLPLRPRPNLKRASQMSDYYMNEGEDPEKPYCSIPPYISMASHSAHEQLRVSSARTTSENHYSHLYDRSSRHIYDNMPDDAEGNTTDEEYVHIFDDPGHLLNNQIPNSSTNEQLSNTNDETESYEYMNAWEEENSEDRMSNNGYIHIIDGAPESAAHSESNCTVTEKPELSAHSTYDRLASQ